MVAAFHFISLLMRRGKRAAMDPDAVLFSAQPPQPRRLVFPFRPEFRGRDAELADVPASSEADTGRFASQM
jgi:hypothetical protein